MLIGGFLILILVAGIGGFFAGQYFAPVETVPTLEGTIPIGVIYAEPVEGELYAQGEKYALDEVNAWLEDAGSPVRFERWVEQAETSATKCVERAEALIERGVQIIVGMEWSSHVKATKSVFDNQKVVCLSSGSQSADMAIADDYIFRLPAPVPLYSPSHLAVAQDMGIEAAIMIYTDEPFGASGAEGITEVYEDAGIDVLDSFPVAPDTTDFTPEVGAIEVAYLDAVDTYGVGKVLLDIIAPDTILSDMFAVITTYPELHTAPTFVFDAYATALLDKAAATAATMNVTGFWLKPPDDDRTQAYYDYIVATYGDEPYAFSYTAYDSIWIAALSVLAAGEYDGEKIKAVLPEVTSHYYGLSGWTKLNAAGDRAFAIFGISQVFETSPGVYEWDDIGIYDASTDTLTWTPP
jgi:ABC-type branched-subunit amino acid transport system substrate-binding protein